MSYDRAESREKCRATSAKRMRELRLSLGYKTVASFARAIGYTPGKIYYYERFGFTNGGPLIHFVRAMDTLGLGVVSIDWLFDDGTGRKWLRQPTKRTARAEGNVLYVNF